ncbi:Ppx/GppA phosphatase family protein [Marinigracilibium pacificum]|uniref:Exopolyphosphatase n=1 Tax=Marinigracilibium pacificum TaxID=2729599 RepID=A0A848J152_9BACT|nr:exopolyphosphatase [Marinigracilibium pacificum]NMM49401.1 exopolyphosphatase [Marinigracilibium pacificum]
MDNQRTAVIDLGTNTWHLLIVRVVNHQIEVLHKEKMAVGIGRGGISKGFITEEAQKRGFEAIGYFKRVINDLKVDNIYATATSAMRNAKNGQEIADEILDRFGIKVEIIDGDKEAEYIYHGVKSALYIGDDRSLILDIGGGSVEFIICNEDNIFWKQSFEIGGQRLVDMFQSSDPMSESNINELRNYLDIMLAPLIDACEKYHPVVLIGASGSFDTLNDISCEKFPLKYNKIKADLWLDLDDFEEIYRGLIGKSREERLQIPGMIPLRVDMIVVAVVLIKYVLNTLELGKIRISPASLKEGLLQEVLVKEESK